MFCRTEKRERIAKLTLESNHPNHSNPLVARLPLGPYLGRFIPHSWNLIGIHVCLSPAHYLLGVKMIEDDWGESLPPLLPHATRVLIRDSRDWTLVFWPSEREGERISVFRFCVYTLCRVINIHRRTNRYEAIICSQPCFAKNVDWIFTLFAPSIGIFWLRCNFESF